jgi:hypothetical protein
MCRRSECPVSDVQTYPMLHAFQKAISKTLEFDSCIVLCYHGDKSAICYLLLNSVYRCHLFLLWLIFSVCMTALLILIVVISSIAYRYRIVLQYWYLHMRRKFRLYSKLNDELENYKYNAFIMNYPESFGL